MRMNRMPLDDLGAQNLVELAWGRLSVQARRDQNRDVLRRHAPGFQRSDHMRQDSLVRCGSRDVANRDRRASLAPRHPLQPRASDRVGYRRRQRGVFVRQAGRESGPKDLRVEIVRQFYRGSVSVES